MNYLLLLVIKFFLPFMGFSQTKAKNYYTIPIELVANTGGQSECLTIKQAITDEPLKYDKKILEDYFVLGNYKQAAETFISTKEFEDRYLLFCNSSLLKIYTQNTAKELWEVDLMMVEELKKQFFKDSIYFAKSDDIVPEYRDQYLGHYKMLIDTFQNFAKLKLGKPFVIDFSTVDWKDTKTLYNHLRQSNVPHHDIKEIMTLLESRIKKPK